MLTIRLGQTIAESSIAIDGVPLQGVVGVTVSAHPKQLTRVTIEYRGAVSVEGEAGTLLCMGLDSAIDPERPGGLRNR